MPRLSLERQNRLREAYGRRQVGWQPATERYAALVKATLAPQSRLLDLGCGRGGLVEQLGHPLHLVAGVDPDLASLREHRLPLPRVQATSGTLPFAAGTFDVVFASWLLEHLEQPRRDFEEIARVLRSGGTFVFLAPNRRHPLSTLNHLLGRLGRLQGWLVERLYSRAADDTFPTRYRANTPAMLRQLGEVAGLHLRELHLVRDPTYLAFSPALFRLACQVERLIPQSRAIHLVGVFEAL
ncbi:MAG: class I SAM-dependent methyltransferase [Candidatus Promineifilaceae bacterium]|nr:class I SAM-dependent methyltransferase [Candidatus Promineifilaceae bacterium]